MRPLPKGHVNTLTRDHYTRPLNKMQNRRECLHSSAEYIVPFGVTYEKIGTIQRRLAWPLHKDDTLSRSGRPTGLNIYFISTSELRTTNGYVLAQGNSRYKSEAHLNS